MITLLIHTDWQSAEQEAKAVGANIGDAQSGKEQTMRLIDADALKYYGNHLGDEYEDRFHDAQWAYRSDVDEAPSIDIVRCGECIYYDPPHVEDHGKRIEYKDLPKEAFDELGTGLVNVSYGVNIGGRCCVDYNCGYAEDKRVYRAEDNFCSKGRRPLNSSEKPNNSKVSDIPTGSERSSE